MVRVEVEPRASVQTSGKMDKGLVDTSMAGSPVGNGVKK